VERSTAPGLVSTEASFADATNGLLLNIGAATDCETQTAQIGKTIDGAASWQRVTTSGISDAMCKRGLASADASHAFFTAYGPNSGPVIYRTADSGRTWTASKPLPDPPGFTFTKRGGVVILPGRPRAFGSVVLIDAQPYGEQTRYVFGSTDGGASWTYASTAPRAQDAVVFVTPSRWLQLVAPGQSMETTDSGASWHASASDYSQAAPVGADFVFGDAMVGYATVRGSIARTTDGGLHWTALKTPGTS
jgi:photosystem II stability/assembly factor-like uncharacterized protein